MRRELLAAMVLLAASPASAAKWDVDYTKSKLGFSVLWSNEPFSAAFKSWNAAIDFDPADAAKAHVAVSIDLASEASDEPDFDSGLKGAEGFQTSRFPTARFETTSIVHKAGNAYLASGTLSLRGMSRSVVLPFTLVISGRSAHMTGTAHVNRSDFGVGQGTWAAADPVAHDVSVTVDLVATETP